MDISNLPATVISQLANAVESYIVTHRKKYGANAAPLKRAQKIAMQPFFAQTILDQAKVVVLEGSRIEDPPFYAMAKMMGIRNLPSFANVAAVTNRRFKRLGQFGYILGVMTCLARLDRRAFPVRVNGSGEFDRRRCLFLAFSNSKYTGGKMMIAPNASIDSGKIEYVHWGPIGRFGLVRNLPRLFDGSHIRHPLASRRAAARIEFEIGEPVDVVVDGEVLTLEVHSIEVLPSALDVMV